MSSVNLRKTQLTAGSKVSEGTQGPGQQVPRKSDCFPFLPPRSLGRGHLPGGHKVGWTASQAPGLSRKDTASHWPLSLRPWAVAAGGPSSSQAPVTDVWLSGQLSGEVLGRGPAASLPGEGGWGQGDLAMVEACLGTCPSPEIPKTNTWRCPERVAQKFKSNFLSVFWI